MLQEDERFARDCYDLNPRCCRCGVKSPPVSFRGISGPRSPMRRLGYCKARFRMLVHESVYLRRKLKSDSKDEESTLFQQKDRMLFSIPLSHSDQPCSLGIHSLYGEMEERKKLRVDQSVPCLWRILHTHHWA